MLRKCMLVVYIEVYVLQKKGSVGSNIELLDVPALLNIAHRASFFD
jgi:hypothetical protein